jgi:membrane protease YdiL (CAAX protease family)
MIAFGEAAYAVFPILWTAAALCTWLLCRDPSFDRRSLWRSEAVSTGLPQVMALWAVGALLLAGLVYLVAPEGLFGLLRERPMLWAAIMIGYPVLSVVPQNLVYRAFLFHRYRALFPTPTPMIAASAVAFSFAHVLFHNWVALAITLVGGVIFARTYARTRSLKLVCIEHALYGCAAFTVGLGSFLYHGPPR